MSRIISPSILTADFGHLAREIEMLNNSDAQWIHLDIMDGVFVPNISFGFQVIEYIRSQTNKTLDVHLMIENPDKYLEKFRDAGADILTVHVETCVHLNRTLTQIKELGMKVGVTLNPHTPLHAIEEVIELVDMVLIMSVNPGFGGQTFIEGSLDRVRRLKQMINKKYSAALIEIDGGVSTTNAAQLYDAGCDVLVAGNAIFSSSEPQKVISQLLKA